MKIRVLCITFLGALISGCPLAMFGFSRTAELYPVTPSYSCIEEKMNKMEGISQLIHSKEEGGRPLTLTGVKPASIIHRYRFMFSERMEDFWLKEDWNGDVSYLGGAATEIKSEAKSLVSTTRPLFLEIEVIVEECGFTDLKQRIVETCEEGLCESDT